MIVTNTPIAVISGPVGVGKSSVSGELSDHLEQKRAPHTFIDFDQLRYTFPRPSDDPWGNRLGLKNLADDRSVTDIAVEIAGLMDWRDL